MMTSHLARCCTLLLVCWITNVFGKVIPNGVFPYTETLDDNFKVSWNFNETHTVFRTRVKTNGYIGFGFSSNGAMFPSDVIIGWVDDNGQTHFADRHATGFTVPSIDISQDWFLLDATESGEYTTLIMIREHETCDSEDMPIMAGTTRVIFSYFPTDPVSDEVIPYHGPTRRGAKSINFRKPNALVTDTIDIPSDAFTFDFRSHNYSVPAKKTMYACTYVTLPDLDQKHHLIKVEPIIQEGHELLVHHILIYTCLVPISKEIMGNVYECYTEEMPLREEDCPTVMIGWAIGGKGYYYPPQMGHSLGLPGDPKHFRVAIHYDNPGRRSDFVDSSGLQITITKQLRQYDGGLFDVGVDVHPYQIIPPFQPNYVSQGFCAPECLAEAMDDGEIYIVGGLLHTHLLGRKVRLRHIRNGTELPYLDQNQSYDFNFQEQVIFQQARTVKKGDWLLLECEYDSSHKSTVTFGGLDNTQEMCLGYMLYYPRMSLGICTSITEFGQRIDPYDMSFLTDIYTRNWHNPNTFAEFEKARKASDLSYVCKGNPKNLPFHGSMGPRPPITEPYIPPKPHCSKG